MKKRLLPFLFGFLVFASLFFALDFVVMGMQGLSLVYKP